AGELVRAADVHQRGLLLGRGEDLRHLRPQRAVHGAHLVLALRELRHLGGERGALLVEPLGAATVEQPYVLVPVDLVEPEAVGGEPVARVTVDDDGVRVLDARLRVELLEVLLRNDVALQLILELGGPVPAHGAGDVAGGIQLRVDVDLHDPDVGGLEVLLQPVDGDEDLGVCVIGHDDAPSLSNGWVSAPAEAATTIRGPGHGGRSGRRLRGHGRLTPHGSATRPGTCLSMLDAYLKTSSQKIITPQGTGAFLAMRRAPSKMSPELGPARRPSWRASS